MEPRAGYVFTLLKELEKLVLCLNLPHRSRSFQRLQRTEKVLFQIMFQNNPSQRNLDLKKSVDFVVPTFDRIEGVNCCVNCKKGNHLTDSIVCQLCSSLLFMHFTRQCQVRMLMIQLFAHLAFLQVCAL